MADRDGVNNRKENLFMSNDQNSVVTSEGTVTSAAQQEQLVPQSKVNDLIQMRAKEAYQKGLDTALQQQQTQQQQYTPPSPVGMTEAQYRQLMREEIEADRKKAEEAAHLRAQREYGDNLGRKFDQRLSAAKSKFEDFDSNAGDTKWENFIGVVHLVNEMDDDKAAILLNELGNNFSKLVQLETGAQADYKKAKREAEKIVKSIESNDVAASIQIPKEPLTQMRQTSSGIKSGKMTDAELLRMYRR